MIDNLTQVLNTDIANIKELIDLEKGLRFGVQKLKELITTKFEFLANPYYVQGASNDLAPTNDIASEIERLTEELDAIDGKSHCGHHSKILRSFNNVKFRWEKVHESGTLLLEFNSIFLKDIADR